MSHEVWIQTDRYPHTQRIFSQVLYFSRTSTKPPPRPPRRHAATRARERKPVADCSVGRQAAARDRLSMPLFGQYELDFDGHTSQQYFYNHPQLPALCVAAYLVMVSYGPRYMASRQPYKLRTVSRCWNVAVALFSLCGAWVCVPHLTHQLRSHGFWYTVCADIYELAGMGPPALWATLFTWSKLFELFDTALLILKKRPVITLHWFHHASVIGFAWSAWAYETPAALWYGAMNYSVHAIMYLYFALTASSRFRAAALSVAPAITALQISQFAFGTVVNVYAAYAYMTPSVGCAIRPPILYIAATLYVAYGTLFVRLFVDRYIRPTSSKVRSSGGENGANGCHKQHHASRSYDTGPKAV